VGRRKGRQEEGRWGEEEKWVRRWGEGDEGEKAPFRPNSTIVLKAFSSSFCRSDKIVSFSAITPSNCSFSYVNVCVWTFACM